jgi:CMP-N,N'-diacetyllegionaminic acid synthase
MASEVKVLAIIPARGGSKGLPGKNIKVLDNKPLIAWTIDAAIESKVCHKVIVSTDCEEIAKVATEYGAQVPFLRPEGLGDDNATTVDVMLHAMDNIDFNFDILMLLQPTSPLRSASDIKNALKLFKASDVSSVVSVSKCDKSPFWSFWRNEFGKLTPVIEKDNQYERRQNLQDAYVLNGAIYIVNSEKFKKRRQFLFSDTVSYEMSKSTSVDIDDIFDFKFAEILIDKT